MKNLILTLGIVLLMTMGMYYDVDSTTVICERRQLKWVCEEMADAAVWCAEKGRWNEAESLAEEILRRNMGDSASELAWNLTRKGNTIRVKVEGKTVLLNLPLPAENIVLAYETEQQLKEFSGIFPY